MDDNKYFEIWMESCEGVMGRLTVKNRNRWKTRRAVKIRAESLAIRFKRKVEIREVSNAR